jgi:hypothetical protein
MRVDATKVVLLSAQDGPESIEIYTSEDQAVVDWSCDVPALYVHVTLNGAACYLGPFCLIRKQVEAAIKGQA